MFEDSKQTSLTVDADNQKGGFTLTVSRNGERVTLDVRYRSREDALRAGNTFLSEWQRTGEKPRG